MKKPLLTKRQRALQELEHASQAIGHALSLLGGRTRYKPRTWPNTIFSCRQYLEGIQARLDVVTKSLLGMQLVINVEGPIKGKSADVVVFDDLGAISPAFPRDEFEATYDKEREPLC